jgi:hypothetical protein
MKRIGLNVNHEIDVEILKLIVISWMKFHEVFEDNFFFGVTGKRLPKIKLLKAS